MAHSRPTPQQILTDLALEAAREATWQGFFEAGVQSPMIDPAQNLVVGTIGDGVLQAARIVSATFERSGDGTQITFTSRPVMGGVIETGKAKLKKAEKVADKVEAVLARGWTRTPQVSAPFEAPTTPDATVYDAEHWNDTARVELEKTPELPPFPPVSPLPPVAPMVAPIAAPGAPQMDGRVPSYGAILPAKQGTTLIVYGVLGMLCCQILAPFTVYYSTKALKTYGDLDPGDKTLVKAARILGIIGCIFLVLRVLSFAGSLGSQG